MSELQELDLSDNEPWRDGEALGEAFEAFRGGFFRVVPLRALKTLRTRRCVRLTCLPSSLNRLCCLKTLDLGGCEALRELPAAIGDVQSLTRIDLSDCFSLRSLPDSMVSLRQLSWLNLDYCDSLTSLPDLSALDGLHVELLPERLATWERAGRKAFDFLQVGPDASVTRVVDLSFYGGDVLPRWMATLVNVRELNLTGCEALTSVACVSSLAALETLKLAGCRGVTSVCDAGLERLSLLSLLVLTGCDGLLELPDLSHRLPTDLRVVGLPTRLEPWEDGRRAAFVFDPTAPPPPQRKADVRRDDGAPAGEEEVETMEGEEGNGGDEQEKEEEAGPAVAAPADQSIELAMMDWGDAEVSNLAVALAAGVSINGRHHKLDRVGELNLGGNAGIVSANELGRVLCQLPRLQVLRLDGCTRLASLPAELGELSALTTLDLEGCTSLRELPGCVGQLAALESLQLSRSGLRALPDELGELTALRSLKMDGMQAMESEELPASMVELISLEELEISEIRLRSFRDGLFALPRLRMLDLGLPTRLSRLDVDVLDDPNLPRSIGLAVSLEELSLSFWSFDQLPEEIGRLSQLRRLSCMECHRLRSLPRTIGALRRLELLELVSTRTWSCPDGPNWVPGQVVVRMPLDSLPDEMRDLAALKELTITQASFDELPAVVGELPALLRLSIAEFAQGVPAHLSCQSDARPRLTKFCRTLPPTLEALSLSFCSGLRELPAELFSSLIRLQEVSLMGCDELVTLPDVSNLAELTSLNLTHCWSLEHLPEGLGSHSGCCVTLPEGQHHIVGA